MAKACPPLSPAFLRPVSSCSFAERVWAPPVPAFPGAAPCLEPPCPPPPARPPPDLDPDSAPLPSPLLPHPGPWPPQDPDGGEGAFLVTWSCGTGPGLSLRWPGGRTRAAPPTASVGLPLLPLWPGHTGEGTVPHTVPPGPSPPASASRWHQLSGPGTPHAPHRVLGDQAWPLVSAPLWPQQPPQAGL